MSPKDFKEIDAPPVLSEVKIYSGKVTESETSSLSACSDRIAPSPAKSIFLQWTINAFLYLCGLFLFFSFVTVAVPLSYAVRIVVKIWMRIFYEKDELQLITRGVDGLWATESGPGGSASNIVIALKCKGAPCIEKLKSSFNKRILNPEGIEYYQKLKYKIVQKYLFYCWEKSQNFSIHDHFSVKEAFLESVTSMDQLMYRTCEEFLRNPLPSTTPQWHGRLLMNKNCDRYVIVFCIHHCYGDGLSWVQMLRSALADAHVKLSIEPTKPLKTSLEPCDTKGDHDKIGDGELKGKLKAMLFIPHYFASQVTWMLQEKNYFHGPFVKNKKTCLSLPLDVPLKDMKTALKIVNDKLGKSRTWSNHRAVTFTSLISHCITGALGKLFKVYGSEIPETLLAILPYAQLPYKDISPVNQFYGTLVPLFPSTQSAPCDTRANVIIDRLTRCNDSIERSHKSYTKDAYFMLAQVCGTVIAPLQRLFSISAHATIAYSNIPGPNGKLSICSGDTVDSIMVFPPIKYSTAITVGIFSYADSLNVSIGVDQSIPNSSFFVEAFLSYFQAELQQFIELSKEFAQGIQVTSKLSVAKGVTTKDSSSFLIPVLHA